MNADRLLALYDRVAEAPDAVPRLRRFVLDLAVRGKLVAQDPADEPASELLKRIATEKARLVKAGRIRNPKVLPPVDEPPFDLPPSWRWTRIREVTSDRGQKVPKSTFTYIDVTAIDKGAGVVSEPKVIEAGDAPSRARKITRKNDVIYSCVRPYLLNVAVIEKDFEPEPIASTAFAVLNGHGFVLPRYLWIVLRSPYMVACVEESQRGQAYPAINDADFAMLPFPLPPHTEQRRIVAKLDELMALCNQLEAARTAREATRDRLTAASLARLTASGTDVATFRANAHFALDVLPVLTARRDQIKVLRQTILNLAVRGRLVIQDPTDEAVKQARRAIDAEREELVRAKLIRRERPLLPLHNDQRPFDIPASWEWARIGEVALFTQYGTSTKAKVLEHGVPVMTMGNIQDGLVIWGNERNIPSDSNELPNLFLKTFDLLYNRTNSAELVGKTGIYLGDNDCRTFASYLIRIRLSLHHSNPRYVNMAMNASSFRETQIVPLIKKQTGQANVNGTALKNMLVPVPPLPEQHRIVSKVDALMAVCDRLDASLYEVDAIRRRLFDASLQRTFYNEALTPTVEGLEAAG